jgi:hypothetical protein
MSGVPIFCCKIDLVAANPGSGFDSNNFYSSVPECNSILALIATQRSSFSKNVPIKLRIKTVGLDPWVLHPEGASGTSYAALHNEPVLNRGIVYLRNGSACPREHEQLHGAVIV